MSLMVCNKDGGVCCEACCSCSHPEGGSGRGVWPGVGWLSTAAGCAVLCVALAVSGCQGRVSAKASPAVDLNQVIASYASAGVPIGAVPTASASVSGVAVGSLSPQAAASRQAALSTPLPERLEHMDDNTPWGAAQSGRYFMKLYTYTFTTGDTSQIEAMSEDTCGFCNSVIGNAKKIHSGGGWVDSWDITVSSVSYKEPTEEYDYYILKMIVTNPVTTQHSGNGEGIQTELEEDRTLKFAMRYSNGGWVIHEGENSK